MDGIDGDTLIMELLREHPGAKKVLARHGMMCTGCQGMEKEKLRHAAQNHGVPVKRLIKELKATIKT